MTSLLQSLLELLRVTSHRRGKRAKDPTWGGGWGQRKQNLGTLRSRGRKGVMWGKGKESERRA